MWIDAAMLVTACVLAVRMGLISEIGRRLHYEFKILTCPKCCTFWVSLIWHIASHRNVLDCVAVSFISSYVALWLSLAYDLMAGIYNNAYAKISSNGERPDAVSDLPELKG